MKVCHGLGKRTRIFTNKTGNTMSNRLEIDVLRALKAVHDMGGVSRAAETLSLSQSAVSHKIRRLEKKY